MLHFLSIASLMAKSFSIDELDLVDDKENEEAYEDAQKKKMMSWMDGRMIHVRGINDSEADEDISEMSLKIKRTIQRK